MASGGNTPRYFARKTVGGGGSRVLIEVVVVHAAGAANVDLKTQDAAVTAAAFQCLLAAFLGRFQGQLVEKTNVLEKLLSNPVCNKRYSGLNLHQ